MKYAWFVLACVGALASLCRAQDIKVLQDFEDDAELPAWEIQQKSGSLSDKHATHGTKCLKLAANEYLFWYKVPKDWTPYDTFEIDVFVDGDDPVAASVLVADEEHKAKPGYWNRHNSGYNLKPGANTISVPVNGLFRGEAGSRGNDIKTNINPKAIVRFDLGFQGKGAGVYVDYMRLVKESRPEGIQAFDFGPESQTVFPGFTPVSWNTVFGQNGNKAGMKKAGWGKSLARDDTFPTRLYQDFVEMGTDQDCHEFIIEVPNGKYHVWVVYDDCGFWGGETCHHTRRSISAEGKEAWVDDRGAEGPADYLFRFENLEPKPGDSLWDLYMKDLFKPARFTAEVADGQLNLDFKADKGWSSKVAAVIAYPDAKKGEGEKWVAEVEARNRKEFESRAMFVGPKAKELDIPANAKSKGWWLGFPNLEENVTLADAPGKADGKLHRVAAKGQRVTYTFAIRPLKDFGAAKLSCSELQGPGGSVPVSAIDLRYVHHQTGRGFNDIAYHIKPESLRRIDGAGLKLGQDFTRQFWITLALPPDAKAGTYTGEVSLTAGGLTEKLPLSVEVLDWALDEPDFVFAYYGFHVPWEFSAERKVAATNELFKIIKENGMNTISGGPNIPFKGFDAEGKPQLDFAACDEFFKAAKAHGFTREFHAYGGPAMVEGLHDGYTIGATGEKWAKQLGKPISEVLKIVWSAVKEHAEKEQWPPVALHMCDEPRVVEPAREHVELYKAYQAGAPWVKIGGSYSVHWGEAELDKAIQDIFKNLVFSALNLHTQKDMDAAKEFGRQIYIYNQGIDRFSFGAYQFAEMRKGVKGRVQWHLLALHGYQFFDLDGREPDFAMLNWGRKEIIPTIHFHRSREGADDFRFAVTLWNLAEKKKSAPEAQAVRKFLEEVNQKIGIGQRQAPKDWMGDEAFRATCIEHLRKLQVAK